MNYSFTLLKTKSDCETLINLVKKEKASEDLKKRILEGQYEAATTSATDLEASLQSVAAEIAAFQSMIAVLPEGTTKDATAVKLRKSEHKLFLLTESKKKRGVVSLIDKEFDIGSLEKQIAEADAFIDAATQYMNSL